MKFINYLEGIAGISVFPMFSLLIFVTFFCACLWYVIKADDRSMDLLKNIPLDEGNPNKN